MKLAHITELEDAKRLLELIADERRAIAAMNATPERANLLEWIDGRMQEQRDLVGRLIRVI